MKTEKDSELYHTESSGTSSLYIRALRNRLLSYSSVSLLCYLLLLQVVNAAFFYHQTTIKTDWLLPFLTGALPLTAFIWILPSLAVNKWLRHILTALIVVPFSVLFIYEYHLLTLWDTPITDSVLIHFHTNNPSEANPGYFLGGITFASWAKGGAILLLLAAISIGRRLIFPLLCRIRYLFGRGAYVVLFSVVFIISVVASRKEFYKLDESTPYNRLALSERFVLGTMHAIQDNTSMSSMVESLTSHSFGDVSISPQRKPHTVVLVMGESLRRLDMHCYGYPLPNTPVIDSLCAMGHMVLYDDVVTCAANTNSSLKSVLTYHQTNTEQETDWLDYPTLSRAFSSAGYRTHWSSNQEKSGFFVEMVAAIAQTCDSTFYTTHYSTTTWMWGKQNNSYDEAILPLLQSHEQCGTNLLQIIHLMGSHALFEDRYPADYAKFSGKDIPESHALEENELSAQYMNSVYYSDYVLGEIIKRYENSSAIVIYLSDHGLVRYDDPKHSQAIVHANAPTALQIPFMVYMSPRFMAENPDISDKVKTAHRKPFMTDLLPNSLAALMGIKNSYSNPLLELWSDEYDYSRKRIITGWDALTEFTPKHPEYQSK